MLQRLLDARTLARARARSSSGFTLIELLIVIVILGVLAGVVVFAVSAFNNRGEEAACKSDVKAVEVAVEAYRANEHAYPDSLEDLEPTYLRELPNTTPDTGKYWVVYDETNGGVQGVLAGGGECASTTGGGGGGGGPEAPGAVTGLAIEGTPTDDSATITWTAVDGATSYSIELTGGQGEGTFTDDAAPFAFSGLAASTNYTVNVRAVNDAGSSDPATISFTTAAPPAVAPDVTNLQRGSCSGSSPNRTCTITWSQSGTTPITIQWTRDTRKGSTCEEADFNGGFDSASGTNSSPVSVSGLSTFGNPDPSYCFRVVATNSAGSDTEIISFTAT